MTPAERHREVAAHFTARVQGTTDWDVPAPVDGWVARDVVEHLVTWLPAFLGANGVHGVGPGELSADIDPAATWQAHVDSVQTLLDGPGAAEVLDDPRLGTWAVGDLVDMIYTADVFMHTWDLSRATGQDATLDADTCAALLGGMEQMEDAIRNSGQYGPRFEVPADADTQTRLLGFIGRDPDWRTP